MKKLLRTIVESSFLHYPIRNVALRMGRQRELEAWERAGRPVPPPKLHKHNTLLEYARRYRLRTLVETGTFYGDMVQMMRPHFEQIFSIELSEELHAMAQRRFRNVNKIRLLQGDSGRMLDQVVRQLHEPALFWLDAHYSEGVTARGEKDAPVYEELQTVLSSEQRHVMVIDDARCFGVDPAYPSIRDLTDYVHSIAPVTQIKVQDDLIRITWAEADD
jgi:hypothetical protein